MAAGELNTAEVAFAGCEEVDKLQYMLHIKQLPTREARLAELALYRHNVAEAEAILLQVTSTVGRLTNAECICFASAWCCHSVVRESTRCAPWCNDQGCSGFASGKR